MKRAIVIGASSGIGREVSRLLVAGGWHLGIAARREDKLLEIKELAPSRVKVMRIDVTADDAPARLLALVRQLGGVSLFAGRDDIAHAALGAGIGVPVVEPVVNGESVQHRKRSFLASFFAL